MLQRYSYDWVIGKLHGLCAGLQNREFGEFIHIKLMTLEFSLSQ